MPTSKIKSPSVFGELIRDLAFKKNNEYDFGCYSTFDMEEDFKEVDACFSLGEELLHILFGVLPEDEVRLELAEEMEQASMYSNGTFHLA